MTMSRRDAEERALADYRAALGTIIRPEWIYGIDKEDRSQDIRTDGKVAVRVIQTPETDVMHWNDDFLDPYWNVEVVEDEDNLVANIDHPWVFGESYQENGA